MRTYDKNNKLKGIHCNKCCKSINMNDTSQYFIHDIKQSHEHMLEQFIESDNTFQYGSIYQELQIKFDLCDVCYHKLTKSFQIPAEIIDLDSHDKNMTLFCSHYGIRTKHHIEHKYIKY